MNKIHYVPTLDTIFLRSLDQLNPDPMSGFTVTDRRFIGIREIQHLALPFDATALSLCANWAPTLNLMRNLKSLTLMVGSSEKSWVTDGAAELRPLYQWFADGRNKWIDFSGERSALILISQLSTWLANPEDPSLQETLPFVPGRQSIPLSVRIVAWKRR